MVQYLASTATKTVNIVQLVYPTRITFVAPVGSGPFNEDVPITFAPLLEAQVGASWVPLSSATLAFSVTGPAGAPPVTGATRTTDGLGRAPIDFSFHGAGTWTVTCAFAGMSGLAPAYGEFAFGLEEGVGGAVKALILLGVGYLLLKGK